MNEIEKRKIIFENKEFSECLNKERYHLENLISNRFNFLLVFISAIIITIVFTKNDFIITILLIISTIIVILFSLSIARENIEFIVLLNLIKNTSNFKKSDFHPIKIIDNLVNEKYKNKFFINKSKKNLIGYWIPMIISFFLIFLTSVYIIKIFFIVFSNIIFFYKTIIYMMIYFFR